ncbi:hypothetical protein FHS20_001815 [Phyllobacterium endophyticum]|jgi:hypothetical protein|nr:hypothetical protein [Phyllobacterium endophyticum]
MANAIELETTEAVRIHRERDRQTSKTTKPENLRPADQINYDLAPLEGPVIYLTHIVSN